ncbi:MAG: hypothetical protein Q7J24_16085 [Desulfomicrobium sp.]|nr:hypothetical protein [Desulfomicrobium sp.]
MKKTEKLDRGSESLVAEYRLQLLELHPYVKVAHHLPGRLRVQAHSSEAASRVLKRNAEVCMDALRRLFPGVRSVRLNPLAGSLVVEYDLKLMPFALVDAFFRTSSFEQAGELLDRLLFVNPLTNGESA